MKEIVELCSYHTFIFNLLLADRISACDTDGKKLNNILYYRTLNTMIILNIEL